MNGIKINDYNHRQQYLSLIEELSKHDNLKVSMDYGDDQWIGYNEKSKNMYVMLELPTILIGTYNSLCLVARAECGGAVIRYIATDENGREEDFDDYEDLMEEECCNCIYNADDGCKCDCHSDYETEDDDDEKNEEPKRIFH